MNLIPLSISIQQAMVVLFALLCTVFAVKLYAPNRMLILVIRIWLVGTAFAAWSGFLSEDPTHFYFFAGLQMVSVLFYVLISTPGKALRSIPQWILVGLQSFRIVVEIILAELAAEGLFPRELTLHGINFDIATGILGLGLGYWLKAKGEAKMGRAILAFNILGLALLVNIVAHAIGKNQILMQFPMQWLPLFLVPLALALHLVSIKKLQLR